MVQKDSEADLAILFVAQASQVLFDNIDIHHLKADFCLFQYLEKKAPSHGSTKSLL